MAVVLHSKRPHLPLLLAKLFDTLKDNEEEENFEFKNFMAFLALNFYTSDCPQAWTISKIILLVLVSSFPKGLGGSLRFEILYSTLQQFNWRMKNKSSLLKKRNCTFSSLKYILNVLQRCKRNVSDAILMSEHLMFQVFQPLLILLMDVLH